VIINTHRSCESNDPKDPFVSSGSQYPFVSSVVETPFVRASLHGLSTTLEANGGGRGQLFYSGERDRGVFFSYSGKQSMKMQFSKQSNAGQHRYV
jgi:hypothetical protein